MGVGLCECVFLLSLSNFYNLKTNLYYVFSTQALKTPSFLKAIYHFETLQVI